MREILKRGAMLVVCLSFPHVALASGWFIAANVAAGSADQKIENALGTFSYDRIDVLRLSGGGGYLFGDRISGTLEVAWSERGGRFLSATVYHPDGDGFVEQDRTYLDLVSTWSLRFRSGRSVAGLGLSPRISILLSEPEVSFSPLKHKLIPGVDPVAFLGYGVFRIFGRYTLDFGPAYRASGEQGTAKVLDSSFFVGAGIELPT